MNVAEVRAWASLVIMVLSSLAALVGYVAHLLAGVYHELHELNGRLVRQEAETQFLASRVAHIEARCESFTRNLVHQ